MRPLVAVLGDVWRKLDGFLPGSCRASRVVWGLRVEVNGGGESGPELREGHGEVLPVDVGVYLLKPEESEDDRGCFWELCD